MALPPIDPLIATGVVLSTAVTDAVLCDVQRGRFVSQTICRGQLE